MQDNDEHAFHFFLKRFQEEDALVSDTRALFTIATELRTLYFITRNPNITAQDYFRQFWFARGMHQDVLQTLTRFPRIVERTKIIVAQRVCSVCDQTNALFVCSRCKQQVYCGKDCQTKDWNSRHKRTCG